MAVDKKVMLIGKKKITEGNYHPKLRISGFWLSEIGFTPDTLVTADYEYGNIVLKTQGTGRDTYLKFAKMAIHKKLDIVQVRGHMCSGRITPNLEMSSHWLENMGFGTGTLILIEPEQGVINIRRLEVEATTLAKAYRY